jgi:hypothetical protein
MEKLSLSTPQPRPMWLLALVQLAAVTAFVAVLIYSVHFLLTL